MFNTLYLRVREALAHPQAGQGLVEYMLIVVLIAIAVIVIVSVVGKATNDVFSNLSNGLSR